MGKTSRIFAVWPGFGTQLSLFPHLSLPPFHIHNLPWVLQETESLSQTPGVFDHQPISCPQHSARRLSSFPSLQGLGKEENTHSSCYTEPFFAYWWEEPKNCYFSKGFWNLLSMGLTAVQPRMPATHSSVSHRTPASSTARSRDVLDILLHQRFLIQELLRMDMFYTYRIIAIDC